MTAFEQPQFSDDSSEVDAIFTEITNSDEVALMRKATADPYITDAQSSARRYNEVFAHEKRVSVDESFSIQGELDRQLIGVNEEQVQVTGKVFTEKDGIKSTYIVADTVMKSRGFTVRGDYTENEYGKGFLEDPKAYLAFKVGRAVLDSTYEGEGSRKKIWVYADVDDVLVEAKTVSQERAAAWIESNYPELFEEINSRVFNAEGDEGASLLSLQGLDLASFVPIDDDFTRECVQSYIQDIVDIDRMIYYALGLNGSYAMKHGQNKKTSELDDLLKDSVLARISPPYIGCEVGENAPDKWSILTEITVAMPTKNESPVHVRASIDAIRALNSIRAAYYGS